MSSLGERLARLRPGAGRAAPGPLTVERTDVPRGVPGDWRRQATEHGVCLVLTDRLPLDAPHGRHTPRELATLARELPEALGALAGQPGTRLRAEDLLFLDVESTGLQGGAGTLVFLVGLAYLEPEALVCEQLLLRDLDDEPALLALLGERASRRRVLCTFNGRSFDRPLLASRHLVNRLVPPAALAEGGPHLDLLFAARRLFRPRVGSCRLAALEPALLDVHRERRLEVAGAEIGLRYRAYLASGDGEVLAPVLHHNRVDVLSMTTLLTLVLRCYALSEAPAEYDVLMGTARLATEHGDLERATLALEQAARLRPDEARPLERLATLHERRTRRLEQALEATERLLALARGPLGSLKVPPPLAERSRRRAVRLRRQLSVLWLPFPAGTI